jgi:hypothetical protein
MDHEEMRAAYMRALDLNKTDFTEYCNICKNDYIQNSGEITDLVTLNKIYKMWYCDDCSSKEVQLV